MRIIIADDPGLARMFTRKCLMIAGYAEAEYIEAQNGEAVMKLTENVKPDMIVTDLYMPGMDGLELVRALKAKDELKEIPIIIVTSAGSEEQRRELIALGVNDILTKPINPQMMAQSLARLFPEKEKKSNDAW
jgi:two-component system chemotaxis response regulator CheY